VHRVLRLFLGTILCSAALAPRLAALPRTYLEFSGGAYVLTGETSGDVVDTPTVGLVEVGIGTHLTDNLLLEGTFGVHGDRTGPVEPILDPEDLFLPESERTWRLEANPMMLRLRYARSGMRTGYLKPEFHLGLGFISVTRWLQPIPGFAMASVSDLLLAGEVGVSALFILGKNWMAHAGPRYTMTQREDLVDSTHHLDGVSILLGFRFFLNSPRDDPEGSRSLR